MKVHDEDACGDNFSDLAHDVTRLIHRYEIDEAIDQIDRCKHARLDVSKHYSGMNNAHAFAYILVDYLLECVEKIHSTTRFAEAYGGTTTIRFSDHPMRFTIELSVSGGKRIFTVKKDGYDSKDIPSS